MILRLYLFLKNCCDLFFWFLLLIIISNLIWVEFILVTIFFLIYFLEFFLKFFINFFFLKKVKPIQYINCVKIKNIKLKFFFFFVYDFPSKWAFYYFYNILKYLLKKNKNFFLINIFKDYNLIIKIIKIIAYKFVFSIIITFFYLAYTNTNYVYSSFYEVKNYNINNNVIFFNIFLLNIMIDYNFIYLKVKDYKIIISNKEVKFNLPKLVKTVINLIDNKIITKTKLNVSKNGLNYKTELNFKFYNTLKILIIGYYKNRFWVLIKLSIW